MGAKLVKKVVMVVLVVVVAVVGLGKDYVELIVTISGRFSERSFGHWALVIRH